MCQYQKPSRVWERGVKENAPNIKHGYWTFSKAKTYINKEWRRIFFIVCLYFIMYNECTISLWDFRMEDCQSCLILHIFKLCCQYYKGTYINDVRRFLTILTPHPPLIRFCPISGLAPIIWRPILTLRPPFDFFNDM